MTQARFFFRYKLAIEMIPYCEVVSQPRLTYSINFSLEYLTEFPIFKQGITPFLVSVQRVLVHTPKSLLASSDRTVSDSILSTMEIPFQLKILKLLFIVTPLKKEGRVLSFSPDL